MPPKVKGKASMTGGKQPPVLNVRLQMSLIEEEQSKRTRRDSEKTGSEKSSDNTTHNVVDLPPRRTLTKGPTNLLNTAEKPPQNDTPNTTRSHDELTSPNTRALELLATVATTSHTTTSVKSSSSDSVFTLGFTPTRPDPIFASYCTHTKTRSASSVNTAEKEVSVNTEEKEVADLVSLSGSEISTETLEEEQGEEQGEESMELEGGQVSEDMVNEGEKQSESERESESESESGSESESESECESARESESESSIAGQGSSSDDANEVLGVYVHANTTTSTASTTSTSRITIPNTYSSNACTINTTYIPCTSLSKRTAQHARLPTHSNNNSGNSFSQEDVLSLKVPRLQEPVHPTSTNTCTDATSADTDTAATPETQTANTNTTTFTASTTTALATSTTDPNATTSTATHIHNTTPTTTTTPSKAPTTPTTTTPSHTTPYPIDAETKRAADIAHLERLLGNKEVRDQLSGEQLARLRNRLVALLLRDI